MTSQQNFSKKTDSFATFITENFNYMIKKAFFQSYLNN